MNFNGERLKEARIYRGMTITQLSEKLNLTKQMISKYENGLANPNFETVAKLMMILNFPKQFFYEQDLVQLKVGNTFFRSLLSISKREQERQQYPLKIVSIMRTLLDEYVEFPDINLPFSEIESEGFHSPEQAATYLREYWEMGENPIPNMVELLESKGFIINAFSFKNTGIDAFGRKQTTLIRKKQFDSYVISLSDDSRVSVRRRFNAAHELAHFLLHDLIIDSDELTKEQYKKMEVEAHEFAGAFLLPAQAFVDDILAHPTDLNNYIHLKRKWKVSISAMTMRAYKLGVITLPQYQQLQRKISFNNWRKTEPLDDKLPVEEPSALKQAIQLLIEHNVLSGAQISSSLSKDYHLSMEASELEHVIGLDPGTLKPVKEGSLVALDLKLKNAGL
ncbi:ImmA/IrrE family metallo-endopeptidase [Planomicrobium sp. MB-3u-38]|uniref:helix-turn-helix domain-containing protein n=1 Tax=Planomicrobium sp. MB-3u-38 TaxID=2058318 RepID=UPI000C7DDD00|nr:XRE family transcriptional regulator [Planomicrobium sp. MB-3u-38]PKH10322.1 DNA-binding protein [Planomicrobium sp. MB-3u-38]